MIWRQIGFVFVLSALAGCTQWKVRSDDEALLERAVASHDSVSLDIFFARFPAGDEQLNAGIWQELDEQQLALDTRRELQENGFRAGLAGQTLPTPLANLLKLTDDREAENLDLTEGAELETDPMVRRRLLQLRCGRRGEVLASGVYDELPLILCDGGEVTGRTYPAAQGVLAIETAVEPDGRVRLSVTPELQYGQPRQQFTGEDGIFRLEMSRPKEVYEDLRLEVLLNPGEMLVLSCRPDRSGSLGYHFFTGDSTGDEEQKVLVVRVARRPEKALYASR